MPRELVGYEHGQPTYTQDPDPPGYGRLAEVVEQCMAAVVTARPNLTGDVWSGLDAELLATDLLVDPYRLHVPQPAVMFRSYVSNEARVARVAEAVRTVRSERAARLVRLVDLYVRRTQHSPHPFENLDGLSDAELAEDIAHGDDGLLGQAERPAIEEAVRRWRAEQAEVARPNMSTRPGLLTAVATSIENARAGGFASVDEVEPEVLAADLLQKSAAVGDLFIGAADDAQVEEVAGAVRAYRFLGPERVLADNRIAPHSIGLRDPETLRTPHPDEEPPTPLYARLVARADELDGDELSSSDAALFREAARAMAAVADARDMLTAAMEGLA